MHTLPLPTTRRHFSSYDWRRNKATKGIVGRLVTDYELKVNTIMIISLRYNKGLCNLKIRNDYWTS